MYIHSKLTQGTGCQVYNHAKLTRVNGCQVYNHAKLTPVNGCQFTLYTLKYRPIIENFFGAF